MQEVSGSIPLVSTTVDLNEHARSKARLFRVRVSVQYERRYISVVFFVFLKTFGANPASARIASIARVRTAPIPHLAAVPDEP